MELIKLFSGSEIESMAIINVLKERKIEFIIKDQVESARLGGFGNFGSAVEIFINKEDFEKAKDLVS